VLSGRNSTSGTMTNASKNHRVQGTTHEGDCSKLRSYASHSRKKNFIIAGYRNQVAWVKSVEKKVPGSAGGSERTLNLLKESRRREIIFKKHVWDFWVYKAHTVQTVGESARSDSVKWGKRAARGGGTPQRVQKNGTAESTIPQKTAQKLQESAVQFRIRKKPRHIKRRNESTRNRKKRGWGKPARRRV